MFVVDLGIRCFSMLWGGLCLYDMASPCCSTYHGSRICRAALPGAFNWRYSPPFSGKNLFGVNVRQLIEKSFVMFRCGRNLLENFGEGNALTRITFLKGITSRRNFLKKCTSPYIYKDIGRTQGILKISLV